MEGRLGRAPPEVRQESTAHVGHKHLPYILC